MSKIPLRCCCVVLVNVAVTGKGNNITESCVSDNASSVGLAVGLAVGFVVLIIIVVVVVVVVVLRRRRSRSSRFHTSLLLVFNLMKYNTNY